MDGCLWCARQGVKRHHQKDPIINLIWFTNSSSQIVSVHSHHQYHHQYRQYHHQYHHHPDPFHRSWQWQGFRMHCWEGHIINLIKYKLIISNYHHHHHHHRQLQLHPHPHPHPYCLDIYDCARQGVRKHCWKDHTINLIWSYTNSNCLCDLCHHCLNI